MAIDCLQRESRGYNEALDWSDKASELRGNWYNF